MRLGFELYSAWIEWAGNERDDHRLVALVIQRLRRCVVPPEDCLADDGGLGKVVINQLDREGYPLRRFDFNGEPRDKALYRNARDKAYFGLADRCRMGHVNHFALLSERDYAGEIRSYNRPVCMAIRKPPSV